MELVAVELEGEVTIDEDEGTGVEPVIVEVVVGETTGTLLMVDTGIELDRVTLEEVSSVLIDDDGPVEEPGNEEIDSVLGDDTAEEVKDAVEKLEELGVELENADDDMADVTETEGELTMELVGTADDRLVVDKLELSVELGVELGNADDDMVDVTEVELTTELLGTIDDRLAVDKLELGVELGTPDDTLAVLKGELEGKVDDEKPAVIVSEVEEAVDKDEDNVEVIDAEADDELRVNADVCVTDPELLDSVELLSGFVDVISELKAVEGMLVVGPEPLELEEAAVVVMLVGIDPVRVV